MHKEVKINWATIAILWLCIRSIQCSVVDIKLFCPTGWTALLDPIKCFTTIPVKLSWFEQQVACRHLDAPGSTDLASIDNHQVNQFLCKNLHLSYDKEYWIGFNSIAQGSKWEWSGGELEGNYSNWKSNDQKNSGFKCAIIYPRSCTWKTIDCNLPREAICQMFDFNPCEKHNGGCAKDAFCQYISPMKKDCICKSGYLMISGECVDIDECENETHSSTCVDMVCLNTPGSWKCVCEKGYRIDHRHSQDCIDDNECAKDNGGCDQWCYNTVGSYSCHCDDGYTMYEGRCDNKYHFPKTIASFTGVSISLVAGFVVLVIVIIWWCKTAKAAEEITNSEGSKENVWIRVENIRQIKRQPRSSRLL